MHFLCRRDFPIFFLKEDIYLCSTFSSEFVSVSSGSMKIDTDAMLFSSFLFHPVMNKQKQNLSSLLNCFLWKSFSSCTVLLAVSCSAEMAYSVVFHDIFSIAAYSFSLHAAPSLSTHLCKHWILFYYFMWLIACSLCTFISVVCN